jgi:ribonucleotide monophosphatase NagD (HAD superfamily)
MIGEKCKQDGIEISNYYMIGDNPLSDIEGANRRGEENFKKAGVNNWRSILVKTGVW